MNGTNFGELQEGDKFRYLSQGETGLIWTKAKPFIAYGFIKDQNAATYVKPNGPWHYARVNDNEVVIKVESHEHNNDK